MTETNQPNDQLPTQPGTGADSAEARTAQPGTAVPAAVDPDTSADADPDTDAGDPLGAGREATGGETIGADSPGRAGTTEKDPSEWVTGDEPMTGAQRSYLDTLARQAGEQLPADLSKAEASEHIDRLQRQTGRGAASGER
jgi:Protein of unknown function (DUF3072)